MTTNEKIAALRAAAQAAGAHGVLLMTSDPHSSEYLPAYYNSLPFFSGFTGENSTLVVTLTGSALWCDGRFYVQGDRQLAGTEIECMHAGSAGVPTVEEYLTAHFAAGQTLLLDGSCVPATIANGYAAALAKSGAKLESKDIVSPLWESLTTRPSLPNTPCELLTVEQTGATAAQRIAMVRDELKKAGATALAVTGLDCVGWLTNMRARDLPCTPLAVAYALVTMDSCTLFIAPGRLNDADTKTLADNGVSLRDYPELIDTVHALPAEEVFLVDEKATNYDLYCALNEHKTVTGADPIFALKGVKNPVELANIRECHVRDGVAMVRFQMDLEKAIAEGKSVVDGVGQYLVNVQGAFEGEKAQFEPGKHALGITYTMGKLLRETLKLVKVVVNGVAAVGPVINTVTDSTSKAINGQLSSGGALVLGGVNLKLQGDDPSIGVYLTPTTEGAAPMKAPVVIANSPSQVIVQMPTLADGQYTVSLTTQYSGSRNVKEPRTYTFPIILIVGEGGGGDSESPDEI